MMTSGRSRLSKVRNPKIKTMVTTADGQNGQPPSPPHGCAAPTKCDCSPTSLMLLPSSIPISSPSTPPESSPVLSATVLTSGSGLATSHVTDVSEHTPLDQLVHTGPESPPLIGLTTPTNRDTLVLQFPKSPTPIGTKFGCSHKRKWADS
ncbi:hypothetical protein LIPSTDRAFT_62952 [Lipomyces starkeyi NRRL Y-11557]|uniref:Uncharacterized protein n=1 Tax=Lipomyces starkeyi NRRL Y-11557 TaxID=675824 RepID=A0A1E3Q7P1_LIPST|nr:hypothetical protein LIPSTDRAFT_62952 [Lipomyces starkeyi NRRL Y-11557]